MHSKRFLFSIFIFISLFLLSSPTFFAINQFPAITAHRGYHATVPENTLAAVTSAITIGCDSVEIDVQQTKDGIIVLSHDKNLAYSTGKEVDLFTLTYKELINYPLLFHSTPTPYSIPTLEEVLKLAQGRINLNIEVKYTGHEQSIIKEIHLLLQKYQMEEQCILTSFHRPFLVESKQLSPTIRTGYILDHIPPNLLQENIDVVSLSYSQATPLLLQSLHQNGKELHVWTVNNPVDIKQLIHLGVDNIITDFPILVIKERNVP